MRTFILAALMLGTALPAHADSGSAVKALVDEYWALSMKESPIYASSLGIDDYASEVGDFSLAGRDRFAAASATILAKLQQIDASQLTPADAIEYGILKRTLEENVEANRYGQRSINFSTYAGWHQNFAGMADNLPFRNKADYESYNARLKQYGRVNDQSLAVANEALKGKYVLPCVVLDGYEKGISGLIADDTRQSRYFAPYARSRPANIDEAEWTALSAEAASIIGDVIYPALNKHLDWFAKSYKPNCAKAPGISAQPGGKDYYNFRIRQETTTNLNADQIHALGLKEVARIRAEMVEVATRAGFASREAFIQHLRTDPRYYAKTPEELMEKVARVNKTIDGKMPGLFHRLPRLPYGIKEIPAEIAEGTTTAFYSPGSPAIGVAGFYYVNTSKLDQRPFWEIPALSVHEAVPGHHNQIALQQELELSDFRKNGAFFTAFTEGWGLYSERLGIEMGLYDTPAKDMGRLSYEMWRACRLVVDTGIHAKGWSKEQAIAYMTDNSALSAANIEAEVNRYISWPGQALAYKLGELKIRELRELATRELGAKFDLAAFHDTVLGQGSVPLNVLEDMVKDWIAAEKAKA
ncbi:MAG: DUF885 domain-containing protein [Sphingomonadaceae bacterium]|nr:DUF885 domain-containing protein [Sphingomonadaceae bacterium]